MTAPQGAREGPLGWVVVEHYESVADGKVFHRELHGALHDTPPEHLPAEWTTASGKTRRFFTIEPVGVSGGGTEQAGRAGSEGHSLPERWRAVDSAAPEFRTDEGEETREVRDALADLARFVRQGADCLLCGRPLGETHDDMCAFGVVSMHVLLTTDPLRPTPPPTAIEPSEARASHGDRK